MNECETAQNPACSSNDATPVPQPFPVVGIGASAGGLEALELFLSGVPTDSGMAYVIVQHLDPTHKGMMPELLQRITCLPVVPVTDHLNVLPDHVYVLPPNHDISIQKSVLYLSKPAAPRGQRLPINFFLNSLALDYRKMAVAVLLSGMGSDGTEGLGAIKKNAGLVLVQDPSSAAFPSMPQSAIDAGLVDIIASAGELPKRIIASLRQESSVEKTSNSRDDLVKSGLDRVLSLMQAHNGQDFSLYKKSTLYRRIERRMGVHQLGHIGDYVRLLEENAQELDLLFKELLIGVTSFFRDPAAWDSLRDIAFPALFQRSPSGRALRAWVPACSTGEEAYSIAISFKEALEVHQPAGRFSLHIFATDLAQDAVDLARLGHYAKDINSKVSAERLARYFIATDDGYQITKEVREMVIFAPQNMAQDPPFTKLDLLSCRNVLIYFGPELQQKLLALFHYSLTPGGILFLGNSETIGSTTHLFEALDSKTRLYRRLDSSHQTLAIDFPTRSSTYSAGTDTPITPPAKNLQILADQLLLREFAPAAVLVNASGDIIYICGRTGRYLEPAAGKANWNVYAMARNGLRHALASTLQQVVRERGRVECHDLSLEDDGNTYQLDLTLQYVEEPEPLHGTVMIVFKELRSKPPTKRQTRKQAQSPVEAQLEKSLEQAQDEVKCLREQMQTSGEELKSTNEELQSSNEELQSTNEELTTSKEEMQSLNEELQTVNVELQSRVDDLSRVNDDMQNLLNSTEVATIFLDNRLHIRRFTEQAAHIIKLISADVGRPLSDLASDLDYPDMAQDAEEVLRTLVFSEKQVTSRNKCWFTVRIMPYRTMQNLINGVVITFIDITLAKNLEAELRATVARIENQTQSTP
ncbi:chemotaxis protein CheB [Nitrincola iocasae]|uniref:protein-glutamate O-methyltransferase n=1 Tax=Nitrincola iocasae TaxID=2614693 RepID=A0A5J6LGM5_9GAMM|nr:chemotaxis protein CheB [Nitrincola iocasae]QEW07512.1 chemotaxis protein CheB [Nitrincola iocasae]